MPSLSKTPNIGLNQWSGNEYPKRQDYVDDNLKIDEGIAKKVDKVPGKQLSTEDYTTQEKQKLASLSNYSHPSEHPASMIKMGDGTTVEDKITTHLADYVHQIGYATATGLTNTYSITLNPAPESLVDGLCVAVKINTQNTGASTINVNGLGAKSIKKANGNDVTSGNLKAGSIYTLRYNGINFILQGEGGEYGTATQDKVLSGYTIGTENGIVNGSMPNRGVFNLGLGESVQAGYYSGGTVPIGKKFAQGTVTSSDTGTISVSGLSFRPYVVVLMQNDVNTNDPGNCCSVVILTDFTTVYKLNSALSNGYGINSGYSDNYAQAGFYTVNQITNDGFTASKQQYGSIPANRSFKYFAYGA